VSVEHRGGQWRVRFRDEQGRNRSRTFTREGAAWKFDERVRELKALGQLERLDERPRGLQTVGEWAAHWWETYAEPKLADATLDLYTLQLTLRIIPRWGSTQLRDLDAAQIERWVAQLAKQGTGNSTILNTLAVMSGMLKRAERDGEIDRNPIPLVAKPPSAPQREPVLITPLQVERIRAWLLAHRPADVALRDATLVSLLAYAGPRPESEAIVLPWGDVGDLSIRFVATKHGRGTRKPRDTKLLAPLAQDLREWRMASGRPPLTATLFPGVAPGDLWDTWRRSAFQPAARAVGLPAGVRPRDLRSSFVSLLVYEGWNTAEVARQLGHSVHTCERNYLRIFREWSPEDRKPAEQMIREARAIVAGGDQAQEAV
jgi:integrase